MKQDEPGTIKLITTEWLGNPSYEPSKIEQWPLKEVLDKARDNGTLLPTVKFFNYGIKGGINWFKITTDKESPRMGIDPNEDHIASWIDFEGKTVKLRLIL